MSFQVLGAGGRHGEATRAGGTAHRLFPTISRLCRRQVQACEEGTFCDQGSVTCRCCSHSPLCMSMCQSMPTMRARCAAESYPCIGDGDHVLQLVCWVQCHRDCACCCSLLLLTHGQLCSESCLCCCDQVAIDDVTVALTTTEQDGSVVREVGEGRRGGCRLTDDPDECCCVSVCCPR